MQSIKNSMFILLNVFDSSSPGMKRLSLTMYICIYHFQMLLFYLLDHLQWV